MKYARTTPEQALARMLNINKAPVSRRRKVAEGRYLLEALLDERGFRKSVAVYRAMTAGAAIGPGE